MVLVVVQRAPAPQEAEVSHSGRKHEVLTVDLAKLKPENELRRIFGSRVVDSESRDDHAGLPHPPCRVSAFVPSMNRSQFFHGIASCQAEPEQL